MAGRTTKEISQAMAWTICIASILFIGFLTVAGSIKVGGMFFEHHSKFRCISQHQEVAQINSFGKRGVVTICDQYASTSH